MAYTDLTEVRACYAQLRELVIHNAGGWEGVESRDLFSREGHLKWNRRNMSGADYLRLQILIALEAVNTRLFFIDTLRARTSQMPHPHAG